MALADNADFFDPSVEFLKAKNGYESKRGYMQSTLRPNWTVPKTTWGDVVTFSMAWLNWINPEACMARMPPGLYTMNECRVVSPTSAYLRAQSLFDSYIPTARGTDAWVASQIDANTLYPWNDQFWTYGMAFALELASEVNLPTSLENMYDSIEESVAQLPSTIWSAVKRINPTNLLPDPSPWVQLFKWGSIAAGLAALYYYVLKPKKS